MKIIKCRKEIWKKIIIKKQITKYSISNLGKVRNDKSNRILKPQKDKKGYMRIQLHHDGIVYTKKVHRLVARAFLQKTLTKKQVNHIDGNKSNNKVENLEWCTNRQNQIHAWKIGLQKPRCGLDNPGNKYSPELIEKICNLLEKGYSTKKIKKCLNIKSNNICISYLINDIRKRKGWVHISKNYNW